VPNPSPAELSARSREVAKVHTLPPDPSIVGALGRGHDIVSAIADIVDNSIDAGATRISIRFVASSARVLHVRIRDDGHGMSMDQLLDAMTLGKRREYAGTDLGHFGLGLKASSMSQARQLTVITRCGFEPTHAMRIRRDGGEHGYEAAELTADAAEAGWAFAADAEHDTTSGTVIDWAGLDAVSAATSANERAAWLDELFTSLSHRLGLIFHRLLTRDSLVITIDQWVPGSGSGAPVQVRPLDPFASQTGAAGFPKVLRANSAGGTVVEASCHVLPPNSTQAASVRLMGRERSDWQGFYIYRNDRLLASGDWLTMRPSSKRLQLCRVAIELTPALESLVRINPEKHGVVLLPEFQRLLEAARADDGSSFSDFLETAEHILEETNRRERKVKPLAPVSEGLREQVISAIGESVGVREGDRRLRIAWRALRDDRLYDFDHEHGELWFNAGYRAALESPAGEALRTAAYLLVESRMKTNTLHAQTRAQVEAEQAIMAAAFFATADRSSYDPFGRTSDGDELELEVPTEQAPMPLAAFSRSSTEEFVHHPLAERVENTEVPARAPAALGSNITAVVRRYERGESPGDIAESYGLTNRDIIAVLSQHYFDVTPETIGRGSPLRAGANYDPEERHRIAAEYLAGQSVEDIAAGVQRSPFAIAWKLLVRRDRPVLKRRADTLAPVRTAVAEVLEPGSRELPPVRAATPTYPATPVRPVPPVRATTSTPTPTQLALLRARPIPLSARNDAPAAVPTAAPTHVDVIERYEQRNGVRDISGSTGLTDKQIVKILAARYFGLDAGSDPPALDAAAAMHVSTAVLSRLESLLRGGASVHQIADRVHRPPIWVAWALLMHRRTLVLAVCAPPTSTAASSAPAVSEPAAPTGARDMTESGASAKPGQNALETASVPSALDVLERYASGESPDAIATMTGLNKRAVLNALLDALFADGAFEVSGRADRRPFDAEERARLESEYRRHKPLARIAKALGRSPRDVGVQLLESPRRPVVVPRRLLRTLRAEELGAMPDETGEPGGSGRTLGEAVMEAHSEGLALSQIAERFTVDIPTVMLILSSARETPAHAQQDAGHA
jgi:DNA-directed RNA polymerase specialized sigma24 family protein